MTAWPERGMPLPKALTDRLGGKPNGEAYEELSVLIARLDSFDAPDGFTDHQASHIRMFRLMLVAAVEGANAEINDHGRDRLEALVAAVDGAAGAIASLMSEVACDDPGLDVKLLRGLKKIVEARLIESLRHSVKEYERADREARL